jgi:choline transport protein
MAATYAISALMGFLMVISFAFCIPDLKVVVQDPHLLSAESLVTIFHHATRSKGLATAMTLIIVVLLFGASLSVLATSARHIFVFAKDEGLPFPHLWRKTTPIGGDSDTLPVNAFVISLSFTTLTSLLYLAYSAAMTFAISVFLGCSLTAYLIVLACVLKKRLFANKLPVARWSLGSFSIPINALAWLYLVFALVMCFFPTTRAGLSPKSANWSILVWAVVLVFASAVYAVHGRYVFRGASMAPGNGSFDDLPSSRNTRNR